MFLSHVFQQAAGPWIPLSTHVTLELVCVAVHVLVQVWLASKLGGALRAREGTCTARNPHYFSSFYLWNIRAMDLGCKIEKYIWNGMLASETPFSKNPRHFSSLYMHTWGTRQSTKMAPVGVEKIGHYVATLYYTNLGPQTTGGLWNKCSKIWEGRRVSPKLYFGKSLCLELVRISLKLFIVAFVRISL